MKRIFAFAIATLLSVGLVACGGGGSSSSASTSPVDTVAVATPTPTPAPRGTSSPLSSSGTTPAPLATATATPAATAAPLNPLLVLGFPGFAGSSVATLPNGAVPRELAALPNGDLIIGIGGSSSTIYILPNAEAAGIAGAPKVFATIPDTTCDPGHLLDGTQGVAFAPGNGGGTIFVGRECGVYSVSYHTGDQSEGASAISPLFAIRQGSPVNLATDGDVHHTTSVAVSGNYLYTSVGSSCNACAETDTTRAVVLRSSLTGGGLTTVATRIRNAVALAPNPSTGAVWAGGAGQDCLTTTGNPMPPPSTCISQDNAYITGHPFEFIDPITTHAAPADYMWPGCEENKTEYLAGYTCANMVVGSVHMPAYSTILGAAIYPKFLSNPPPYAFPSTYQGGLFVTMHGSWHETSSGTPVAEPAVAFVPLNGDAPVTATNWSGGGNPYSNWATVGGNPTAFLRGFQNGQTRIGRPVGVAVGASGSLFISDDNSRQIYRIRPSH